MKTMQSEEQNNWLTASVFMSMEDWTLMLSQFISPWVGKNVDDGNIFSFQIEFNHNGGDNIRVCVLTKKERAFEVSQNLAQNAHNFFEKFKKKEIFKPLPPNGIFMPFPQNCIKYGLFQLYLNTDESHEYSITKKVGELILEVFNEEQADAGSIFLFALFLQMAFANELINIDTSQAGFITSVFDNEINMYSENLNDLKEKFENIQDSILEIFEEIKIVKKQLNIANEDHYWLYEWILFCSLKLATESIDVDMRAQIYQNYRNQFMLINSLLGLDIKDRLLLSYSLRHFFHQFF